MVRRKRFLGGLVAAAGAPAAVRAVQGAADLIVVGGTIHTVDEAYPAPTAFAVRGDRFIYVGAIADAMALRGPSTLVLDAGGRTILSSAFVRRDRRTSENLCASFARCVDSRRRLGSELMAGEGVSDARRVERRDSGSAGRALAR